MTVTSRPAASSSKTVSDASATMFWAPRSSRSEVKSPVSSTASRTVWMPSGVSVRSSRAGSAGPGKDRRDGALHDDPTVAEHDEARERGGGPLEGHEAALAADHENGRIAARMLDPVGRARRRGGWLARSRRAAARLPPGVAHAASMHEQHGEQAGGASSHGAMDAARRSHRFRQFAGQNEPMRRLALLLGSPRLVGACRLPSPRTGSTVAGTDAARRARGPGGFDPSPSG